MRHKDATNFGVGKAPGTFRAFRKTLGRPAHSTEREQTTVGDVFIAAIVLNSSDKLMANILTYLPPDIHYLFIIKISLGHAACHYSDALGEKRLQLNK